MSIYRMFNGTHIDFGKVLSISPATFDPLSNNRKWGVMFSIEYQLRDTPVVFTFEGTGWHNEFDPAKNTMGYPVVPTDFDFGSKEHQKWAETHMVKWLQDHVDVIITEWKKSQAN